MNTRKADEREIEAVLRNVDLDLETKARAKEHLLRTQVTRDGLRRIEDRSASTWRALLELAELRREDEHGAREFVDKAKRDTIVGRYLRTRPKVVVGGVPYEQPWSYGMELEALRAYQRREDPFDRPLPAWAADPSASLAQLLQRKREDERRLEPRDFVDHTPKAPPKPAKRDEPATIADVLGLDEPRRPRPVSETTLSGPPDTAPEPSGDPWDGIEDVPF